MVHLKNFQKLYGLTPDGIIGPKTISVLKKQLRISKNECLASFLAQTHHETLGFTKAYENLVYSSVERIVEVFKKDFDRNRNRIIDANELEFAKKFVRNPEGLANFCYQLQDGNGDEASGDGFKFRGRGALHLTTKNNYVLFSKYIGEDCVENPDLVAEKYFFESAVFFFNENKLWNLASNCSPNGVRALTQRINPGLVGLNERISKTNAYLTILNKY